MKIKILIIDDDRKRQEEWEWLLELFPVQIIQAFSIDEAEKIFNDTRNLDGIVVDACVPGHKPNTMEIVRNFRRSFSGPLIAISSIEIFNYMLISAGCNHKSEKDKLVEKIKQIFNF